ncbi:MAG: hypothetical protein RIC16_07880 [Rhodospirillales bacterium]
MMGNEAIHSEIKYPSWTDYRKKNGLDPLGMQNSSVNLYQRYLPGISNVTLRMRYYGLYAWLCRTYALSEPSDNPEDWKRFVRRAEALYALIAHHTGNQNGVAGILWAGNAYEEATGRTIDIAAAADPGSETAYLKQAWGAYGAAYGSQLFAIGIFWESPEHVIPVPSNTVGDRLAQAFSEELGDVAELFVDVIGRGVVMRDELDRLTPIVPSEIGLTGDERALYQEILLTPLDPGDLGAVSRRQSLLLVLNIAGLLGREPDVEEVRWILYAGQDQQDHPLVLSDPELERQRQRWWVYHANDLCHIALETLLKFTLDTLAAYPSGLALNRLIPLCVDRMLEDVDSIPATWSDLLDQVQLAANAYTDEDELAEWALSTAIMKNAGRGDETECPPETVWCAVLLLATLHRRVRDEDHPVEDELERFTSEAFQTLLTETYFLDANSESPFKHVLAKLIEHRVLRRHLWVAARKFQHGDYTFLIESDEGRIRLREKDGPALTNPRLGPAITFLKDIHLISGQGLTDYGAEALRNP